jgi:hypothetical protein
MTVKGAAGDVKICLSSEWFLMNRSPNAIFNLVFKRGTAPFLGGLTSRFSLLSDIPPRIVYHA